MFTSFFQGSGIAFLVDWLGLTLRSWIEAAVCMTQTYAVKVIQFESNLDTRKLQKKKSL